MIAETITLEQFRSWFLAFYEGAHAAGNSEHLAPLRAVKSALAKVKEPEPQAGPAPDFIETLPDFIETLGMEKLQTDSPEIAVAAQSLGMRVIFDPRLEPGDVRIGPSEDHLMRDANLAIYAKAMKGVGAINRDIEAA